MKKTILSVAYLMVFAASADTSLWKMAIFRGGAIDEERNTIAPVPAVNPPSLQTSLPIQAPVTPTVSQRAALLLSNNLVKSLMEPGDGVFISKLMDPESRRLITNVGEVKAYRPVLFQKLRHSAGISEEEFSDSLDFVNDALSCLSADSKSGQAFWVSKNHLIVVKTIKPYECRNLRRILDTYAEHMLTGITASKMFGLEESGGSCISSVLGLYRVTLKSGGRRYFMVNKNVYPTPSMLAGNHHDNNELPSSRRYDLKGSTVGRKAKPPAHVMKDLDLMASGVTLSGMGQRARKILLRTLERDAIFLRSQGFMDYSLLVAVESTSIDPTTSTSSATPLVSTLPQNQGKLVLTGEDGKMYHFGVIDFLQRYTFRKVLETMLKGIIDDATKISCVAPSLYAKRMLSFIAKYSQ